VPPLMPPQPRRMFISPCDTRGTEQMPVIAGKRGGEVGAFSWKALRLLAAFAWGFVLCGSAASQSSGGAVWVDPNGTVVGPLVGNNQILLKIPAVGNIVLIVGEPVVYPTQVGEPIRYVYTFNVIASSAIVIRYPSADCSGQGYVFATVGLIVGADGLTSQFFDSVNRWLVVASGPVVHPPPQFNSQLVQGIGVPPLEGPGAYCQTVDVFQGGPVMAVTHVINQSTLASPPLSLR
jgi:hypothetical protein